MMGPWEFLAWAVAVAVSLIVIAFAIVVVTATVKGLKRNWVKPIPGEQPRLRLVEDE